MRTLRIRFVLSGCALVLAAACGGSRTVIVNAPPPPPPPFQPILVAVVPFDNATLDMDSPPMLRNQVYQRLGSRGYLVQNVFDTDAKLREMGITLPGQLKAVEPKELREKLGVDAVLSGTITVATSIVTGVYNRRTLEADIVLTDVRTGSKIWTFHERVTGEDQARVPKTGLGMAISVARGVERSNLSQEANTLANIIASRMPRCPREGEIAWGGQPLPPPTAVVAPPAP